MTDSDPQLIRHATIDDLDALAAMESECFPAAEAADRSSLRARIETYPECFWLLIDGEIVMAFINGFATDRRDLTDDMYEDAAQHNPQGDWQMIFGVDTAPKYQHRGCASTLMRKVIEDTRAAGRKAWCSPAKIGWSDSMRNLGMRTRAFRSPLTVTWSGIRCA